MTRSGRVRDPEARLVRVVRLVHARPHTLFGLLADPRNHARLDGRGMLRGDPVGPSRLKVGDTFTMGMSQAGKAYLANLAMLAVEWEHHEILTTTVGENRS
jgi:hypothetical protein